MRVSAGRLGVLAERDFRFVFLAGAVSQIGDQMMPVAIAFAVLDLTGSAADVGYVLAAGTAPLVALLPRRARRTARRLAPGTIARCRSTSSPSWTRASG